MPKGKKKDHGFIELSPGQDPIVDIIAIHGVNGHREQSWTVEDGTMWLRDLLPNDIPNARILSYGYDADPRKISRTSTQNIFCHAEAFAEDLSRVRKAADPKRPIIFLAHSLGGIILRRTLVLCHGADFETGHNLRDISTSTFGVLFFGTPHSGASGIQLAEWMGRVVSIYMSTNDRVLKALSRDSSELENIQRLYLPASEGISTSFFYEEYATPIVGGMEELIVPRHLTVIHGGSKARIVVLQADHCQIVKYTGKGDINYRKVVDYLAELVGDATVAVEENHMRENGYIVVANGASVPFSRIVLPSPSISISRNYVQRQNIYNLITEKLFPLNPTEHQSRCILYGPGGGGKTQIASFWIEKHKNKFSRIIVVDASSWQLIEAYLETMIRSIGPQFSNATWKDAVAYLSGEKGWLLFFDNADEPNLELDAYFPSSIHGVVLVTTRNRECVAYAPDSHIKVGQLTENEALGLLHKVANVIPSSNDASLAIVKELGMWALAITQAGAYIFKTRQLDNYLVIFHKHRKYLTREASLKRRNYKGSPYTAFVLSFGLLPKKAQELMKICASLHHSSLPRALFKRSVSSGFHTHTVCESCPPPDSDKLIISDLGDILGSKWDDLSFQTVIDAITRGSLMDISTNSNGQCFYNIHALVRTYVRELLAQSDQDRYSLAAGQLLLGAVRPLEGESNVWHRQLLPHIDQLPMEVKTIHASHSLAFLMVYKSTGSWNLSQTLQERCHSEIQSLLGPKHPDTVSVTADLTRTLHECDQLEEAETMGQEVLALQKEILGPRHLDTVSTMANLAIILQGRGQVEEAERMKREVLALQTELLGPRHPHAVTTMANLAITLGGRGQVEEAERIQREVLVMQMEILGPRHLDTVNAMRNLVVTLEGHGRLEEAERMEREVISLQTEILGPHHPDTASAMGNLAITLRNRGQVEEAERMQREVLALQKEILGPRHPHTVSTMVSLAITLKNYGQVEEAERIEREALALRMEIFGPRHLVTVKTKVNLAVTLGYRGQVEEAEKMEREVLALRTEILGSRHPDTISVMSNLAITLGGRGQVEEAERMEREVLALRKEILGPRHPKTVLTMSKLAVTLRSRGQVEEAEKIEREVLALQTEILGSRHPDTVNTMANLASTLRHRGQVEEAERMEREVLALRTEILGPRHPDTVNTMANLAIILKGRGQVEEAEKMEREVLALQKEILGPRHPDTVDTMANLAITLGHRGQVEEAERMQREVLALRMEILGPRHLVTVETKVNLAVILGYRGQVEEAENMEREALALRTEILGSRHPDTISVMSNLAITLGGRGQVEEAERMQREVLALRKEILGPRHPDTLIATVNRAITLRHHGQLGEAENMTLEAAELQREILGPQHPDTVFSMSILSSIRLERERLAGVSQEVL